MSAVGRRLRGPLSFGQGEKSLRGKPPTPKTVSGRPRFRQPYYFSSSHPGQTLSLFLWYIFPQTEDLSVLSVVICHGFVVLRKNLVISDVSFYRDAVTFSNLVSMRNQRLIDKGMAPIEYELSLYSTYIRKCSRFLSLSFTWILSFFELEWLGRICRKSVRN